MKTKIMMQVLSAALIIQIAFLPDFANAQADFYRGKTVTIIHGRSAGGSGEMRARAGRDQEGRDCVFRICLELQEAPTTKRFDFLLHLLELGFPVYISDLSLLASAAAKHWRKTSFSSLSTHQPVPTTLDRREPYSGADPVAELSTAFPPVIMIKA